MSEENKEDVKEQQDFLSGHEELLNSINKTDAEENPEPPAEDEEAVETEAPIEEAAEEPIEEPAEEPIEEPEPEPTPEPEPIAEPIKEEPEPVEEPVAEKTKPSPTPSKTPSKKNKNPHPKAEGHPERNETEKKRHEELLKHQALENAEVKEVLNVIQKYAKPVVVGIVVVCALFLSNNFFKGNRIKKEAKADAALMQAKTAADFQAILDDFGSTPSAPLAMMGLAQEKFNTGQLDEAENLYGEFAKKYGHHEMAAQAEFNQITCKEAKGELSEATILYGEFKNKHGDSHLAPVALLGKARCLEALDNYSEAKRLYEDIITFYPESGWSQIAESNLAVVESKLK
ncbi:MAG: tetratricopeptide repeat protein [Verrucomicrobiota bacterium]|nr:tetratricopeptide repeat protein [Verrucomicrobiota bacterium]